MTSFSGKSLLRTLTCLHLIFTFVMLSACENKKSDESPAAPAPAPISENGPFSSCTLEEIVSDTCRAESGSIVTNVFGVSVTEWSNPQASNKVTAKIPNAYYANREVQFLEPQLLSQNIASGITIFGVTGILKPSFSAQMASQALRDPGLSLIPVLGGQPTSHQMSLAQETSVYAGNSFPAADGFNYRDIPDSSKDDEGSEGITCKYAPRPTVNCGQTQTTIAERISHCAAQNPTSSIWDGTTQCSGGQGAWKLVTRSGLNKEVWQDQRTGLLWSSMVSTAINWCQATGNTQAAPLTLYQAYNGTLGNSLKGNGSISEIKSGSDSVNGVITITFSSPTQFTVSGAGCEGGAVTAGSLTSTAGSKVTWSRANLCEFSITQGAVNFAANDKILLKSVANSVSCAPGSSSGLQSVSPVSYCAEEASLAMPAGENWAQGLYLTAKGGLGRNSVPKVSWRAPTIEDFQLANLNGIRMVLPDMGVSGSQRWVTDSSVGSRGYEWSSSVYSVSRNSAWIFGSRNGYVSFLGRELSNVARCVGR